MPAHCWRPPPAEQVRKGGRRGEGEGVKRLCKGLQQLSCWQKRSAEPGTQQPDAFNPPCKFVHVSVKVDMMCLKRFTQCKCQGLHNVPVKYVYTCTVCMITHLCGCPVLTGISCPALYLMGENSTCRVWHAFPPVGLSSQLDQVRLIQIGLKQVACIYVLFFTFVDCT